MHFRPIDPLLFYTRNDSQDPRLGELPQPLKNSDVVLGGYPDDQGVTLGGGRAGSALGPLVVRRQLYKMTPGRSINLKFHDIGDLDIRCGDQACRHEAVESQVLEVLKSDKLWVGIGGGHDYAYPDAKALVRYCQTTGQRPLVINFDAHLDVRPLNRGITSGTAFYRLLKEEKDLDFFELGTQDHTNSREHWDWAKAQGARILSFDEILFSGLSQTESVLAFLDEAILRRRPAMVSVDLDAVAGAHAPGVSAPAVVGLDPHELLRILQVLFERLDVKVFSVYEAAPPLDQDDRTSRLGALFIHRFLSSRGPRT